MALHDLLAVLSGAVIGLLSGLIGVGGGVLLVPLMVLGFGFHQHLAQGTSLAAILPTSVVGALTHGRRGDVDLRAAALMGGVGAVAAGVGAVVALHLREDWLARAFGLFLLFSAYRLWPRSAAAPAAGPEPLAPGPPDPPAPGPGG